MTRTLATELARAALDSGDQVFVLTRESKLTYRECWDLSTFLAKQLTDRGITAGDTVALMMGNSTDQVALWFAINAIGAVHTPLNTSLSGERLAHALRVAEVRLVIADPDLSAQIEAVVAEHDLDAALMNFNGLSAGAAGDVGAPQAEPEELSTATLLFTSGTTGVSKACSLSHRYLVRQGEIHAKYLRLSSSDVLYCPFPLFHMDAATLTVSAALSVRATAALGRRFSASRFWDEVRDFGATVFNFMGATLTILWKQPATPSDRDHHVRLAWGVPLPEWAPGFEDRFGFPVRQVYGLTDAGVPVYDPIEGPRKVGAAGRVIDEFVVKIDPSCNRPGDPDHVGEILVRGQEPGLVMNGYHGMPEATSATIVEGWVRTGDIGDLDEDGFLTFHGRLADSIRRRGENISAFEVEELVGAHPAVVECAALGVPSELTEEDVMVFVVVRPGTVLAPDELHRHCLQHGPAYMAPRYIQVVKELPKTPTEKVEKFKLREIAVNSTTWEALRTPTP